VNWPRRGYLKRALTVSKPKVPQVQGKYALFIWASGRDGVTVLVLGVVDAVHNGLQRC